MTTTSTALQAEITDLQEALATAKAYLGIVGDIAIYSRPLPWP